MTTTLLLPYQLIEKDKLTYQFITDQEIFYEVYFLDYSYMFLDYPHLANKVYTLNLDVSGNYMKKVLKDERVGLTVVEVVRLFFKVLDGVEIYNSLLVHRTNKNLDQITDAFSELNSRNIGDK